MKYCFYSIFYFLLMLNVNVYNALKQGDGINANELTMEQLLPLRTSVDVTIFSQDIYLGSQLALKVKGLRLNADHQFEVKLGNSN